MINFIMFKFIIVILLFNLIITQTPLLAPDESNLVDNRVKTNLIKNKNPN